MLRDDASHDGIAGTAELKDDEDPAGAEDAVELAQDEFQVGNAALTQSWWCPG
jgi:hypothetical protein